MKNSQRRANTILIKFLKEPQQIYSPKYNQTRTF